VEDRGGWNFKEERELRHSMREVGWIREMARDCERGERMERVVGEGIARRERDRTIKFHRKFEISKSLATRKGARGISRTSPLARTFTGIQAEGDSAE